MTARATPPPDPLKALPEPKAHGRQRASRRLARAAAAVALAVSIGWAPAPSARAAEAAAFQALEARLSDALGAYDRAEVDRLWDDDLVFVFPNGHLSRKAERLKAQVPPPDTGGPRLVAKNDAVDVEYQDDHTAVVVIRSSWRFGDAAPRRFVATHVWIKRAQGWRLISAQVAQVPAAP